MENGGWGKRLWRTEVLRARQGSYPRRLVCVSMRALRVYSACGNVERMLTPLRWVSVDRVQTRGGERASGLSFARLHGELGHCPRGRRAVHRGPTALQPHRAGPRLQDGGRDRQDPAGAPGRAGELGSYGREVTRPYLCRFH